ncbi:MAG: DUF5777 family beta-barrel protein [Spirosomataceae bacterium]
MDKIAPDKPQFVTAIFNSTRVINGYSNEIRIGLEYGITDKLMAGVGRSSYLKEYDYFAKYKLLKQKTGSWINPVSITVAGGGFNQYDGYAFADCF